VLPQTRRLAVVGEQSQLAHSSSNFPFPHAKLTSHSFGFLIMVQLTQQTLQG